MTFGLNPMVRLSQENARLRRALNRLRQLPLDRIVIVNTPTRFEEALLILAATPDNQNGATFRIQSHGAAAGPAISTLALRRSLGSYRSQAALEDGANLGYLQYEGFDGSDYVTAGLIRVAASEDWDGSSQGVRIFIDGIPTGSTTRATWLRLTDGVADIFKRRWTREAEGSSFDASEGTWHSCTAGGITATLPEGAEGMEVIIGDEDGNATSSPITIDGNSSETINGEANFKIYQDYQAVYLLHDGTEWKGWYLIPTTNRRQAFTFTVPASSTTESVTFPQPFPSGTTPIVVVTPPYNTGVFVSSISNTGFTLDVNATSGSNQDHNIIAELPTG